MGRPRKPEIGSQRWAENELRVAEARLRAVRKLIDGADEGELPGLLRLEASLRRECERLARAAQPQVLTEPWYGNTRELEAAILGSEEDDE